ncbi:MAG TPA: dihydrofolate reductase [Flavobacteriia bacterium]|nr:dihydrofolate reductase [Flavobacteriia bacterium]
MVQDQHFLYEKARKRIIQKKRFYSHFIIFLIGSGILYGLTTIKGFALENNPLIIYGIITFWAVIILLNFVRVFITTKFFDDEWERNQTEKLIQKHEKKVLQLEQKLQKEGVLPQPKKEKKGLLNIFKKKNTPTIIAAIGKNNELGKDNNLIWHLPADLKRFKQLTTGHHIIMGRKTFESIGIPLPNRTTVIITRDKNYKVQGCITVNSLEEALEVAKKDATPFIIGGADIYNQALKIAEKLEITYVHHEFDADVFFPKIDLTIWEEISREFHKKDDKNPYDYTFVTYKRK